MSITINDTTAVVQHHRATHDPAITFTDAAQRHIVSYLQQDATRRGLRLAVKKTGCSGYSYVIDYVQEALPTDITQILFDDYMLCVDEKSLVFLKGMQIDYVKQGLNAKFVFNNPNQTGECGCGESFTVES